VATNGLNGPTSNGASRLVLSVTITVPAGADCTAAGDSLCRTRDGCFVLKSKHGIYGSLVLCQTC
jgi:hypothetical protein